MSARLSSRRTGMARSFVCFIVLLAFAAPAFYERMPDTARAQEDADAKITEGTLLARGPDGSQLGPCPLAHTDVKARISGFMSRVNVIQEFQNPFAQKIEAVYVFP